LYYSHTYEEGREEDAICGQQPLLDGLDPSSEYVQHHHHERLGRPQIVAALFLYYNNQNEIS
jgi:hypothetical protein